MRDERGWPIVPGAKVRVTYPSGVVKRGFVIEVGEHVVVRQRGSNISRTVRPEWCRVVPSRSQQREAFEKSQQRVAEVEKATRAWRRR